LLLDQRRRWSEGRALQVEEYLSQHPDLAANKDALLDLIYNEVILRERHGQSPNVTEYTTRFPDLATELQLQFAMDRAIQEDAAPSTHPARNADGQSQDEPVPFLVPGYQITRVIGRGGMGIVYQAWQAGLNRFAAIKMVLGGGHAGPDELARFRNEAEAVARLQHPNIVQVYEVGTWNGQPFLALEFVDGHSLAAKLVGTPMAARPAAELAETLSRALQHAHDRGIVHRDLTPGNILLALDSTPKITDFGLAKILGGDSGQTQSGAILGTPSYMSPEQAAGKSKIVGPATDVYSLGAILYETLTGRPPFKAESPIDTIFQVLKNEPVPPRELNPKAPRDLETICLKCLRKEPGNRYGGAGELADDLRRFLNEVPIRARPVGRLERTWRWCRRNPAVASLLSAIALLLALAAAGAGVGNLMLKSQLRQTERAERDSKEKLLLANLERARAASVSRQIGQQARGLEAVAEAAALARELDGIGVHALDLRNAAIACLASEDLRVVCEHDSGIVQNAGGNTFDSKLDRYVHAGPEGRLIVRRVDRNEILHTLAPPPGTTFAFLHVMFSANDRVLLGRYSGVGTDVKCLLWDLETKTRLPVIEGTGWPAFSPDGGTLAIALKDGTIGLFDALTARLRSRMGKDRAGSRLAFDPTGKWLCCIDRDIVIVNSGTGAERIKFSPKVNVYAVAWSHDGRWLAIGGDDRRIHVYDVERGLLHAVLEGHQAAVIHLEFSPRSPLLASYGWDDVSRLWDPIGGRELVRAVGNFQRFRYDGRRLGFVRTPHYGVWELSDTVCRARHHGVRGNRTPWNPDVGPFVVDFSRDGRLLSSTSGDGVRLWDVQSNGGFAHLKTGFTESAPFDLQSDRMLTYGQRGLLLWPVARADQNAGRVTVGPPETLHAPASFNWARSTWSRDGRRLAFADSAQKQIIVIDRDRPGDRMVLPNCRSTVSVALSPSGKWVAKTGWRDATITVWETGAGKTVELATVTPDDPPRSVAFSPDGKWLVCGTELGYEWWRVGKWERGARIRKERADLADAARSVVASRAGLSPLAFAPDGSVLAIMRTPQTIQLVDPVEGREIATLGGAERWQISSLSFSPDGDRLAAATGDDVILLWDLRAIRARLAELGLDWDRPAYAPKVSDAELPLQIVVNLGSPNPHNMLDQARQALAGNPKNFEALWMRAQANALLNDLDKAIADADDLLTLLPKDHSIRGRVLLDRSSWKLLQYAQKLGKRPDPKSPDAKKKP
jgi:WD40 repeat protein